MAAEVIHIWFGIWLDLIALATLDLGLGIWDLGLWELWIPDSGFHAWGLRLGIWD